jgi:hypothetical protein
MGLRLIVVTHNYPNIIAQMNMNNWPRVERRAVSNTVVEP